MRGFFRILPFIIIAIIAGCSSGDSLVPADIQPVERMIWAIHSGGLFANSSEGLATLSDDSIVVTGGVKGSVIFGSGELNETELNSSYNYTDIFISRYHPDGTLLWVKQVGGSRDDTGTEITVLSDNSIVLTGYFYSSAIFGEGEPNETELVSVGSYMTTNFIARYDPDGFLSWAKIICDLGSGRVFSIFTLADNSTAVMGKLYGSVIFGKDEPNETELISQDLSDSFIAHYDSDGAILKVSHIKEEGQISVNDLTVLTDDSIVATGYFRGPVVFGEDGPNETTLVSKDDADIFIVKYHPDGTLAWVKQAGGLSNDYGNGITALPDNSIILTGNFHEDATFGEGEPNQRTLVAFASPYDSYDDMFIARYNPDGTLAWVKQAGGYGPISGNTITTLSDDSVIVAGTFSSMATFAIAGSNQTKLYKHGDTNLFIARYDPDGTLVWVEQAGIQDDAGVNDIAVLSDDSTVLTGHFKVSVTFYSGDVAYATRFSTARYNMLITRFAP